MTAILHAEQLKIPVCCALSGDKQLLEWIVLASVEHTDAYIMLIIICYTSYVQ